MIKEDNNEKNHKDLKRILKSQENIKVKVCGWRREG